MNAGLNSPKLNQAKVNIWNRKHAIGTPVSVLNDDGSTTKTKTASDAWLMGGHSAVIRLEGYSGGYLLSRVSVQGGAQ